MPTEPSIQDFEKLQADITSKLGSFLELQKKLNEAAVLNSVFDTLDMIKLLSRRAALVRLSTKLNRLIKQYPHSVELIDAVVPVLKKAGEALKSLPVKEDKLTYWKDEPWQDADGTPKIHSYEIYVLYSHTEKENKEMAEAGAAFLADVQSNTRERALAKFAEIDATKLMQATRALEKYSQPDKLLNEYNQLKPSGFPLSTYHRKKSTTELGSTKEIPQAIQEISEALSLIAQCKPTKPSGNKNVTNQALLASRIRGCLLQHMAQTKDKTLKKTLTSLLNEPGIKGTGKKDEKEDDLAAFNTFKKTILNPQVHGGFSLSG